MRIAIMQPYFIPYIGYFQLIAAVDKFIVLDDVNYINRGWINRNRISINNQPHWLTIPLVKASQNKLIREIDIIDDYQWKKNILLTIKTNYSKAPFFSEVYPLFSQIINFSVNNLSLFLGNSLILITEYLNIKTAISPTSAIYPKGNLKGQHRILDICLRENATHYYNPPGGKEIYNPELFAQSGVKLYFIEPDFSKINLVHSNYDSPPTLSILDLMMFNDSLKIRQSLESYRLF